VKTTTDSNGLTSWIWLKEYNQTGNGTYVTGCTGSTGRINCTTPHNVTVSHASYNGNSSNYTVDVSQTNHLMLNITIVVITCSPPVSSDWNVSTSCIITSDVLYVAEDQDLNVLDGGSLTLVNTTLWMNSTANGTSEIHIFFGGELKINDSSNSGTMINSTNPNNHFGFVVDNGTNFSMINSQLENAGWADVVGQRGLEINTSIGEFYGNLIKDNYFGLVLMKDNNVLSNNTLDNNIYNVYVLNGTGNIFWDNTLSNGVTDVRIGSIGNTTFLNTSFDKAEIFDSGSGASLDVQWYFKVVVQNILEKGLKDANVSLTNTSSNIVFHELTNHLGETTLRNITEYVSTSSGQTNTNNHTLNTTKLTEMDIRQLNITGNNVVNIVLDLFRDFQIVLNINNTNALVYVPGTGVLNSNDLGTGLNYTNHTRSYVASYSGDVLTGLVASSVEKLTASNTAGYHSIGIQRNMTHTKILLPFTRGDWGGIENRMNLIESGDFFLEITPTFGFGLGLKYPIKLLLKYSDVNIQNDLILNKGIHKLAIESNKSGTKAITIIRQE
ncbi:MAG: hypothetical protein ABIJ92_02630, partial [Candidatus Aenigmatarchaeota archaeon]